MSKMCLNRVMGQTGMWTVRFQTWNMIFAHWLGNKCKSQIFKSIQLKWLLFEGMAWGCAVLSLSFDRSFARSLFVIEFSDWTFNVMKARKRYSWQKSGAERTAWEYLITVLKSNMNISDKWTNAMKLQLHCTNNNQMNHQSRMSFVCIKQCSSIIFSLNLGWNFYFPLFSAQWAQHNIEPTVFMQKQTNIQ